MFLTYTKGQAHKAIQSAFGSTFQDVDFRDLYISLEYPVREQDYPAVWVDFEPLGSLSIVGIGHAEDVAGSTAETARQAYRWRFAGHLTFTAVALTSLERDRLIDNLIRVFAFSRTAGLTTFRQILEGGELIALNADFDQVELRGFSTSPGTPWGSDDLLYEGTVAMEIAGEFINTDTTDLVRLSNIELFEWTYSWESDPTTGDGGGWIGEL